MLELPEVLARAEECDQTLQKKKVARVHPPSSPHKFCWFYGEVEEYTSLLSGKIFQQARGFGLYVELEFSDGVRLCVNDGVTMRFLLPSDVVPPKYQLLLEFTDGSSLVFRVAMYGGIIVYQGTYENAYYQKSLESVSPLSEEFHYDFFEALFATCKPNLSAKAFLATEQRIPGLGNGTLQDILFQAGVHPKRKIGTITPAERKQLWSCVKSVLGSMAVQGGRDTEKDIFGQPGRYKCLLSKNTQSKGCPKCGGEIRKETYLGGAIYYCPHCQPQ